MKTIKLSETMNLLYGEDEAKKVYARCEETDPWFNQHVQQFVYDCLWKLEPLSLSEKSMVTVACLAVSNREAQLQIHLKGCLNLGSSKTQMGELFDYLLKQGHISAIPASLSTLSETSAADTDLFSLSAWNKALLDVVCHATLGDNDKTQKCFEQILQSEVLPEEYIKGVLRHILSYAGCPCTMNGFAVLKQVTTKPALQ